MYDTERKESQDSNKLRSKTTKHTIFQGTRKEKGAQRKRGGGHFSKQEVMVSFPLNFQTYSLFKDAVGVAGNIFAFGLFVSPVPTFRRIMRNKSTEEFSGLPYIYTLLNCLICAWYGTPLVSLDNILVTTVNSVGAVFQLVYLSIFIAYAERARKINMIGLLAAVFVIFGVLVALSLSLFDLASRQIFVGFISCGSLISMFASPLFIIRLVIRTKSVEYMPFYLSLSSFLMSISFFAYGMLEWDPFIYVPNGIGVLLGIVQLGLYTYYSRSSAYHQPLIVSYS